MNLPDRRLRVLNLTQKDQPVLALDTGVAADSLEGLRLVKAARGAGWVFEAGVLKPWVTRGVLQADRRLVVWGEADLRPEGQTPEAWPTAGPEGRAFLTALAAAWAARVGAGDAPGPFSPSAVVPLRTAAGWAFVFPPADLRGVLDSIQPLPDRLAWDHLRHPEAAGPESWAFASAALGILASGAALPWEQPEAEALGQELRDLKRTLHEAELPQGPGAAARALWLDSLTLRLGSQAGPRWKAWAEAGPRWDEGSDPTRQALGAKKAALRLRRRQGAAWWRRKGTQTLVALGAGALVALVAGSVIWGAVKPDVTDTWTPEQVVRGYYAAVNGLDADRMGKVTEFDASAQKELQRDENEVTNLYVIKQVRTAYERKSPVLDPTEWEAAGKPALVEGQMLYGLAGLTVEGSGAHWKASYRKWVHEGGGEEPLKAVGTEVTDLVTLTETGRGWKISAVERTRVPLP